MHFKVFAAAVLASAPLALAQSGMTSKPSAAPTASTAEVVTMMWDNEPTPAAAAAAAAAASGSSMAADMSGMSMGASMTMSDGKVMSGMSGMSGMSMTTATGTAMAGMNMTGSAGKMDMSPGAMGLGWVVISIGAGIGFLAGTL
ncbi:hypothetical protein N0V86_006544 [Didymella sp. IMI 355093]|nr:hypothetical protein N0V86_006544 [Didymella sp. IMI 355093]